MDCNLFSTESKEISVIIPIYLNYSEEYVCIIFVDVVVVVSKRNND